MAPLQISSATAGSASHLRPILARPTKLGWVWSQPQSNNLLCLTNWAIFHSHGQTWVCWVFIATKLKVIFLKQAGQWPSWVEIWCRGAIICNLWPVIAQLGHFSPFWSNWVFSPYHPPSHYYDTISHFYLRIVENMCKSRARDESQVEAGVLCNLIQEETLCKERRVSFTYALNKTSLMLTVNMHRCQNILCNSCHGC